MYVIFLLKNVQMSGSGFILWLIECLGVPGQYGLKFGHFLHAILYLSNEEVLTAILGYWMVCMALGSNF